MRSEGKISTWQDAKGFGFITPADGSGQTFIHITAIKNRYRRPEVGDTVTYTVGSDRQGRRRAVNASITRNTSPGFTGVQLAANVCAIFFLIVAGLLVWTTKLPVLVFIAYLALSAITFVAYGLDKSAARKGEWRTSEGTLHLLALLGGWPGALAAQQTLRHKTRKKSFRLVFWLTVAVNLAGFGWLNTPSGRIYLEQLLANV